jgi:hypothetical protein
MTELEDRRAEREHHAEREQEKATAVAAIQEAFSDIARRSPEPDAWERTFLVQAISSLFRGIYRLAVIDAHVALTPPTARSRAANLPYEPSLDRFTMSVLREALTEAMVQPVEPFPIFGPIVFSTALRK